MLVGQRVVDVSILVKDVGIGDFLFEATRDPDMRFGSVPSSLVGGSDNGGTQSAEDRHLFGRHLLGHGDDGLVALDGTDEGETNTTKVVAS